MGNKLTEPSNYSIVPKSTLPLIHYITTLHIKCMQLSCRNSFLSFSLCKAAPSLPAPIWECPQHWASVTQGSTGRERRGFRLNIDSRPWLTTTDTPTELQFLHTKTCMHTHTHIMHKHWHTMTQMWWNHKSAFTMRVSMSICACVAWISRWSKFHDGFRWDGLIPYWPFCDTQTRV